MGSILKDFEFGRNGFEWMLRFRFWVDSLVFLDGFKLVFDVSTYEELKLTDILVDFEDLMLFVLWIFVV